MEAEWIHWTNEPIYMDKGVKNIEKRKHAVYAFCRDGLVPLLHSFGYTFGTSDAVVTKKLLRFLFLTKKGYSLRPLAHDIEFPNDHYDTYCHLLDTQEWELFWKRWEGFQDFEDSLGFILKASLPVFVWSWLDLERSETFLDLQRELEANQYDDDVPKGRDDLYLQETQTRDYQDRHWH